jgi:hypothetical protein
MDYSQGIRIPKILLEQSGIGADGKADNP